MPRGRRLHSYLGALGLATLAATGAVAGSGCSSGESEEACVSDEMFFAEQTWAQVLTASCIGCHNPQGLAGNTSLVLKNSSEAGFLSTNMDIFRHVATLEQGGESLALLKPTEKVSHGGGKVIEEGSREYEILAEMVQRYKEPSACETHTTAFFHGVQLASAPDTLRMAALELLGRLPTPEEEEAVEEGGMGALDVLLDQYMHDEMFYTRLKEIYGDIFHTDRYLNGEDAVNLLSSEEYNPRWYEDVAYQPDLIEKYGATSWNDLINKLRRFTVQGVAREPLELIAHVVRENRPFTEVVTADYMMVNPFSARSWGLAPTFENDADPAEFVEVKRDGYPHSGVLSSPMWLARHPTSATNLNRHRARMVYQVFLGTDVLKLAERRIDTSAVTDFNPTLNNPNCTVCHNNIDPVAGWFQKFGDLGAYRVDRNWPETLIPPGFNRDNMPYGEFAEANVWGAGRLAKDPRFALSQIYNVLTGLTGQKPLLSPMSGEENFSDKFRAYLAQYYMFNQFAEEFEASNYDIRVVFKSIIKSPYFRARNYGGDLSGARQFELLQLASSRFLTPEALHRKIWAVSGYPWREGRFGTDYLLSGNRYKLLYGGVDHFDVLQRIGEPNGIMANVSDRMANEMSCRAVPRDFSIPQEERLLFPYVDVTFEPKDRNGFDVEPAIEAIKKNIQYLHKRVLGEVLDLSHPEIERTYQLFLGTWQEGTAGMAKPEGDPDRIPRDLPGQCHVRDEFWSAKPLPEAMHVAGDETYTVRAWMSVMTYLLSDYRFLYQ
ncbi:DUF1588 domain-containing protein [Chondromyces crocatus]|uniref:DUF1588 domain-containing protein n=1 Tax=Chondromyces crocatus TaxID=52 RepID=A0A0K1EG70_CHOCO|nr:DUF1588 domain-containing protein [Chondromyces crocatus]AKT39849.1 uncharacterized protein CMC5_040000 [Chondromyces crocatus]